MGSATGRGRRRIDLDRYETPAWATEVVLPWVAPWLQGAAVMDPCCGSGRILEVIGAQCPVARLVGADIDRSVVVECRRRLAALSRQHGLLRPVMQTRDARKPWWWPADLVVTNPPYTWAEEIIHNAIVEIGRVAALLRVGFLESQTRRGFWREHGNADLLFLDRRPSFTYGSTDATAYAWMIWPGTSRWTRIEVPDRALEVGCDA